MDEDPGSPFIVIRGRVLSRSAYRPSSTIELADTPAWWSSLALLGALLAGAGLAIVAGGGETTAIAGVALFLLTAIVAGAERTEAATALAVGAIVWTAAGISVTVGTDGALAASGIGLGLAGGLAALLGTLGARRSGARERGGS
ncbi:MAG TPA: hypothetical protein VEL82_01460 [Thermoplasmata archaeon]|nr:hypothetical protein [Thermoplasmata archaeon]